MKGYEEASYFLFFKLYYTHVYAHITILSISNVCHYQLLSISVIFKDLDTRSDK